MKTVKLRLIGTPTTIEEMIGVIESTGVLKVTHKSDPYPDRYSKNNSRVYVDITVE